MEEIYDLLKKAYASELAADVHPETEATLRAFEKKQGIAIPADYRWLLLNFGAFNFGEEPFLYTLEDLEVEYPAFLEIWPEYLEGYPDLADLAGNIDPFPVGFFGEGSLAFMDKANGQILRLIHDCAEPVPLDVVAESLQVLLRERAEEVVSWTKMTLLENRT